MKNKILITGVLFGLLTGTPSIYSKTAEVPLYSATTLISVSNNTERHPILSKLRMSKLQSQPIFYAVINCLNLQKTWGTDDKELPFEETLQELKKSVRINLHSDTNLIEISVKRNNPEEASTIANEIAKAYHDAGRTIMLEENQLETIALNEGLVEQQKRVDSAYQSVEQIKKKLVDAGIDCEHSLETDLILLEKLEKDQILAQRLMTENEGLEPEYTKAKNNLERLDTMISEIHSRNTPARLALLKPLRTAQNKLDEEVFIYNHLEAKLEKNTTVTAPPRNPVTIIDIAKPDYRPVNQSQL